MASELRSNNARSPRFSTTKALGFRGGSTGAGGNLQEPTFQQVEGNVPAAPPKPKEAAAAPAISQFNAVAPQGSSLPATLASGAASAAGGEAVKAGVRAGANALSDLFRSPVAAGFSAPAADGSQFYGSETLQQSIPLGEQTMSRAPGSFDLGLEYGSTPGRVPEWVGVGTGFTGANEADFLMGDSGDGFLTGAEDYFAPTAVDAASSIYGAGEAVDAAFGDVGGEVVDAGGGVPWVGPALRLAQGDVGGAAGSAAGAAIGSAILPGVGTAIGSFLGGNIGGNCFITEAVMSAGGQGDTAPELQALRQFRDGVLAATPQGQALIQEYESIAPMVVDSVMMRPDSLQIFQAIDAQFINPAVQAIQQGDYQKALQIYSQMIAFVTPYATEGAETGQGGMMMPGQEGEAGAMQKMGEHAAMVGHSPEMAGMATGDMGMMDEDPNGYDGGPQGMPMAGNPMQQQFAKPRY